MMDELYLTVNTEDGTTLCLSPLTDRQISIATEGISDPGGYFLFEKHGSGDLETIEVIAQVFNDDAAHKLRKMLKLA